MIPSVKRKLRRGVSMVYAGSREKDNSRKEKEQEKAEEFNSELEDSELEEVAGGVATDSIKSYEAEPQRKRRTGTQDI